MTYDIIYWQDGIPVDQDRTSDYTVFQELLTMALDLDAVDLALPDHVMVICSDVPQMDYIAEYFFVDGSWYQVVHAKNMDTHLIKYK